MERVQRGATKMGESLGDKTYQEILQELNIYSLKENGKGQTCDWYLLKLWIFLHQNNKPVILTCSVQLFCTEQPWSSSSRVPLSVSRASRLLWCRQGRLAPEPLLCVSNSHTQLWFGPAPISSLVYWLWLTAVGANGSCHCQPMRRESPRRAEALVHSAGRWSGSGKYWGGCCTEVFYLHA